MLVDWRQKFRGAIRDPVQLRINELFAYCDGAYAANTVRGYSSDLRLFAQWCTARGASWLPAEPAAVASYIDECAQSLTPTTVRKRVVVIGFAHRVSDLPSPVHAKEVTLALRRLSRTKLNRPVQSQGLTDDILQRILTNLPYTLAGVRDAALISVGYDSLCRSCEIAALQVEDLRASDKGPWSILVPRSKSDRTGEGRIAWLSPATVERLKLWLDASGVRSGPLFRAVNTGRPSDAALATASIRRLVKRTCDRVGVQWEGPRGFTGHSMRVGAAQDMLVAGMDMLAIMNAGGWKTGSSVLRYVENANMRALNEQRWARLSSARRMRRDLATEER
jgi:integrase/recombinase XerD